MACLSHGGGIWETHDRYRPAPHDGYIIGQLHWLSRLSSKLSSFLVIRHRVIHWRPLWVRIVAECCIRFELGSCAVVLDSSCIRFNSAGSKCTSLFLDCSWLPCLERKSYRRMCWPSCNGHAMVMVVLRSGCTTAHVVSAAHEGFLWLDFCLYRWGRFFLRLVGRLGIFCCWVTLRVTLIGSQLVLFCLTVFRTIGPLFFHRSIFLTVCTMRSANPFDWGYRNLYVVNHMLL